MRNIMGDLFSALIFLLGLIGLFALYNNVTSSNKSNQAFTDLSTMVGATQALYASHPSFASISATAVINSRSAPATMVSGAALINPWGGNVTVAPAANTSFFTVTEPSVPNDACVKMATSLSNLGALSINGTSVTLPADPSVVSGVCTGDANSLVFTFGH